MTRFFVLLVFIFSGFSEVFSQGISLTPAEKKFQIFNEKKGGAILNVGNIMFTRMNTVTMPLSVNAQITVLPNFTVGPVFSYFKFLNAEQVAQSMTKYENVDVRYNQYMAGVRADYHLTAALEKLIRKSIGKDYFDLYVGAWTGYSFTSCNHRLANQEVIDDTQKLRGGALMGVRSMIVPRFGLFLEVGYSSYGIGSFGFTVRLDNPEKTSGSATSFAKKKTPYKAIADFNL